MASSSTSSQVLEQRSDEEMKIEEADMKCTVVGGGQLLTSDREGDRDKEHKHSERMF